MYVHSQLHFLGSGPKGDEHRGNQGVHPSVCTAGRPAGPLPWLVLALFNRLRLDLALLRLALTRLWLVLTLLLLALALLRLALTPPVGQLWFVFVRLQHL